MVLWIRSQDKRQLLKVNDGLYIANGFDDTPDTFIGIKNVGHIGRYKTEKRALEVLDEIQKKITPTLITTEFNSEIKQGIDNISFDVIMQPVEDKITYIQPNVVIYEMPQE